MAAESAPPEQMATAIGWVQTAQRLGPALGPVIGGGTRAGRGHPAVVSRVGRRLPRWHSCSSSSAIARIARGGRRADGPAAPRTRRSRRSRLCRTFCCSWARSSACSSSIAASVRFCRCTCARSVSAPHRVPFLAGVLFTTTAAAAAVGNQASPDPAAQRRPAGVVPVMAALRRARRLVFGASAPWTGACWRSPPCSVSRSASRPRALHGGVAARCRSSQRGVAFGYLTSAYLVAWRSVRSWRAARRAEHARGFRGRRRGAGGARVGRAAGDEPCCALSGSARRAAEADLAPAVEWLRDREASCAFPTDTLYGLAVDPTSETRSRRRCSR